MVTVEKLFKIIDSVSEVKASGAKLDQIKSVRPLSVPTIMHLSTPFERGLIEFDKVTFAYPTRPTAFVLKEFELTIEPGKSVALVGSSGSGKSTLVSLLART